jgi:nucleoside-diphosphate-sugar epimerase
MKPAGYYRALPRRFRNRPVLIVGCGDVGSRIGAALAARGLRVLGTVRTPDKTALRQAGIVPLIADLDARRNLRMGAWATRLIDLAPPPARASDDPRSRHLIAALATDLARDKDAACRPRRPTARRVYVPARLACMATAPVPAS